MARPSSIAKHPQRREIELDIALDVKGRIIARKYGLTEPAICRYRKRLLAERPEYIVRLRDQSASARAVTIAQVAIDEIVAGAQGALSTAAQKIKEIHIHANS